MSPWTGVSVSCQNICSSCAQFGEFCRCYLRLKMQRGMLIVAIFIVSFGLCATKQPREKQKSSKTYTRALEMIRKDEDLRLLMFSPEITKKIPSCLISKYINRRSKGARRTLEINKIETGTKVSQLETTIRIYVNKSTPASLQVKFEG
ncbi:hypothetical protein V5799_025853, partial [Amblyomma americanum]